MIFNVARGVFHSFSTRHQFYTFTKLKSFPRFLSSLQLFLFFRFLLFFSSHLPCPTLFARDPFNLFSIFGFTFFSISFSSFFVLLFFSSHLPCPTLFARDPILFSPTGNTILTRAEVQLTMDDRFAPFSRKIPRKKTEKCHCFGKYIYMAQFKVNGLIFQALIWHISLFNGL